MSSLDPFYLIVPDAASVGRFARLGVRTIQLRYKSTSSAAVRREIIAAMDATMGTECQLIVNDHWREALSAGCDYVHLGQEDLVDADLPTLKAAGVSIGLSTHDERELAVALAHAPDYVALGPIFASTTKDTGRQPQGLARIGAWKRAIGALPLVAIGGITLERAADVLGAGADCCSVVADVLSAADADARAKQWLEATARHPR